MLNNQPILGIDLGEKRTGVALAIMPERMAVPLVVIAHKDDAELAREIESLMRKHSAQTIVVGLPIDLNHAQGIAAQKIRARVEKIKSVTGGEWIFVDESYTTREAQDFLIQSKVSRQRRKEVIDKLAAQNILQSYLDLNK
ncbi:MAG TPA: Holliday junction resolvase RuvX [Candidatus Omnitrophota bacterium]|nr:Holliday junction resolvase RuvX [Candidatus Omnitrophota bacterium]HRK61161.1 Holliday junction resolvase RuvX [Candidatus Omnitrophota bacterium]